MKRELTMDETMRSLTTCAERAESLHKLDAPKVIQIHNLLLILHRVQHALSLLNQGEPVNDT